MFINLQNRTHTKKPVPMRERIAPTAKSATAHQLEFVPVRTAMAMAAMSLLLSLRFDFARLSTNGFLQLLLLLDVAESPGRRS
jgi:hypothetical protein